LQITLKGKASQKEFQLLVEPKHLDMSLLDFLRAQGFPVASSCSGAEVCRKCIIQNEILSCAVSVSDFLKEYPDGIVVIDYL